MEYPLQLDLKFNHKTYVNEFSMDLRSETEDHYYFGSSDLEIKSYIARNIELEGAPDFVQGLPSATKSLFDTQLGQQRRNYCKFKRVANWVHEIEDPKLRSLLNFGRQA